MDPDRRHIRPFSLKNIIHHRSYRADHSSPTIPSPPLNSPSSSHSPLPSPVPGVNGHLSDASINSDFLSLHTAIVLHVQTFYALDAHLPPALQEDIELATTGLSVSWARIRMLLYNPRDRAAALTLCIAWAVLSKCLLLKLGMNNSPGSTFLPPEVVECFQSFSIMRGLEEPENDSERGDLILLSHWKQVSAILLHGTYVANGFSFFDSRNANIERTLRDLSPLLQVYATTKGPLDAARLSNLRDLLQKGARLAFTLFGQPSFWKFDWAAPGSLAGRLGEGEAEESGWAADKGRNSSVSSVDADVLHAADIVIWPALLKIVDSQGVPVADERRQLSKKITLKSF